MTLTDQQIFDQVATHLLKQGVRARREGFGCVYRGENGTKCAAGCLIDDEHYDAAFEGGGVPCRIAGATTKQSMVAVALLASGVPESCLSLVSDLQDVHDNNRPHLWPAHLRSVAKAYGLSPAVVEVGRE